MLTFYHRVTQVLYCKRRLKVVVDQQLHSHFFGLINTFAERETRSVSKPCLVFCSFFPSKLISSYQRRGALYPVWNKGANIRKIMI